MISRREAKALVHGEGRESDIGAVEIIDDKYGDEHMGISDGIPLDQFRYNRHSIAVWISIKRGYCCRRLQSSVTVAGSTGDLGNVG